MHKQIRDFEWDAANVGHISRHSVRDYEVEYAILLDKPAYSRGRDDTYIAYGVTDEGRYLFIVFVVKEHGLIRVITARDMIKREKQYYYKRSR